MRVYVLDASVIIKWVIGADESGEDKAFAIKMGWRKNAIMVTADRSYFGRVKDKGKVMLI